MTANDHSLAGPGTGGALELHDANELLAAHNRRWQDRWNCWCRSAPPPWWARGLVISPDLRGRYESYLPVADFLASLARLAGHCLPAPNWTPAVLQPAARCGCLQAPAAFPSLADFWAALPDALSGKVCFSPDELLPLFCALADPPRFGTVAGRYPEQLADLGEIVQNWPAAAPLRILDIGCGVGSNTLEIAQRARECAPQAALAVTGLSAERLEVWMATARRLPHDPPRERRLQAFSRDLPVVFAHGRAEDFRLAEPVAIIICNGLAGGRFLHQEQQLTRFLDGCAQAMAAGGRLFLANRFHDGHREQLGDLRRLAESRGWHCRGSEHNLHLERGPDTTETTPLHCPAPSGIIDPALIPPRPNGGDGGGLDHKHNRDRQA